MSKGEEEAGGVLADVVKWLVLNFGKDILIKLGGALQHQWRRLFAARNILILGPSRTGKSSLVQYLQEGHPYEVVDGEIRPPAPTALAAIVDKKFTVQKGSWLRLRKDVPGEEAFRDTWGQAIKDVRPQGIIYMIDGRCDDAGLRRDVRGIGEFVLVHYVESGPGHLAALHIFVNFADHWGTSPAEGRRRLRIVHDELEDVIASSHQWAVLRVGVAETQLSPSRKKWEEADRGLRHFGADLLA